MNILRPYQVEDLATYMAQERVMNLSDPGTGKTPPTAVLTGYLADATNEGVVWVQPKSLMRKNRNEILKWCPDLDPEQVIIVDGAKLAREQQIRSEGKVFLMGFQRWSEDWEQFKGRTGSVIVDETHMGYSTHDSQRTQNLYASMKHHGVFIPMTGTMIKGRLNSVYPSIHIIEPRYYHSHQSFMNIHAIIDDWSGKVVGWKNIDRMAAIFAKHAIRHTFKECYGDEKVVFITELCEMSVKQRAAYDEFHEKAVLELEGKFIDGTIPGVFVLRCRQIMCHPPQMGLIKDSELSGKEELLRLHIADHLNSGVPMLIYASMVAEQERLLRFVRKEGMSAEWMGGHTSGAKRAQLDEAFVRGDFQCLVASPQVAAFGFNWEHVGHVIFTSIDYMNDNFVQAYRRAERGTRTEPLLVTTLGYYDSIDQRLFEINHDKSKLSNSVDKSYEILDFNNLVIEHETRETI